MWRDGLFDWIVLGSGYLLSLGLFYWLGGIPRAAEVIKRWAGRSAAGRNGVRPLS